MADFTKMVTFLGRVRDLTDYALITDVSVNATYPSYVRHSTLMQTHF